MSDIATNNYSQMVEQAWGLCDGAKEYIKNAGREVPVQEIIEKVFIPSGFVDAEKTRKESGSPQKVFLKSPYGLQYRPEQNNWIPFRHGPLSV